MATNLVSLPLLGFELHLLLLDLSVVHGVFDADLIGERVRILLLNDVVQRHFDHVVLRQLHLVQGRPELAALLATDEALGLELLLLLDGDVDGGDGVVERDEDGLAVGGLGVVDKVLVHLFQAVFDDALVVVAVLVVEIDVCLKERRSKNTGLFRGT